MIQIRLPIPKPITNPIHIGNKKLISNPPFSSVALLYHISLLLSSLFLTIFPFPQINYLLPHPYKITEFRNNYFRSYKKLTPKLQKINRSYKKLTPKLQKINKGYTTIYCVVCIKGQQKICRKIIFKKI